MNVKRTWKLPDVGTDGPMWIQRFATAVKHLLSPPPYPQDDRILVRQGDKATMEWLGFGTGLYVSSAGVVTTTVDISNTNGIVIIGNAWSLTRRLTNAELLTLSSSPIALIPAVTGKIFTVTGINLISQTTAGIYATATRIRIGTGASPGFWWNEVIGNSQLDSGTFSFYTVFDNQNGIVTGPVSDLVNLPILLSMDADPTGGDPANYAILTVQGLILETV